MKPGYQTTEFYIALIPWIITLVRQFTGVELDKDSVTNGIIAISGVITFVGYLNGRIQLKKQVLTSKSQGVI